MPFCRLINFEDGGEKLCYQLKWTHCNGNIHRFAYREIIICIRPKFCMHRNFCAVRESATAKYFDKNVRKCGDHIWPMQNRPARRTRLRNKLVALGWIYNRLTVPRTKDTESVRGSLFYVLSLSYKHFVSSRQVCPLRWFDRTVQAVRWHSIANNEAWYLEGRSVT